jgi:hypothetical protein
VIGFDPTGRVEVLIDATPFVRVDVPSAAEPLVKVTVPVVLVGSVAVKVTDWLKGDGFMEEARVSVGEAFVTVCVVVPVEELFVVSPL